MKDKIIKNIPNALTFSRILASIAGAGAFISGNIPWAIGLYIWGAVSDFFDGLAARKLNAFSEFGRKLDAVSDKLYAGSLLIPSIWCGNLLMIIPLVFEAKISHINLTAEKMGFEPHTQRIGKFKTATLFATIIAGLLATLDPALYFVLLPLLTTSTILQGKTITVYENELYLNMQQAEKNTSKDIPIEKEELEEDEPLSDNLALESDDKTPKYAYSGKSEKLTKKIADLWKEGCFYVTGYEPVPLCPSSKRGMAKSLKKEH